MQDSFDKPTYLISSVSSMLDVHPQTLRQYEREGLVVPSRTNGKIRLYSQKDIEDIKKILVLTREFGVNISGLKVILQLENKMKLLQEENELLKNKLRTACNMSVVPTNKSIIVKKTSSSVVLFTADN
jgi:MerR family transcriptional regulator/heat shock protein HspR